MATTRQISQRMVATVIHAVNQNGLANRHPNTPKTLSLFMVAVLFGIVACTPQPKIVKRYESVESITALEATNHTPPDVSFISLPIEAENAHRHVFDLAAAGQSALITKVAESVSDADQLMTQIGMPVGSQITGPALIDLTEFERRIVFTVSRGSRLPADRLQWTEVKLDPSSESDLTFVTWEQAVTSYETIDLGDLSLSQQQTGKLTGSIPAGTVSPILGDIGFETSSTNTLTENQDLRRRIVDLNVAILNNQSTLVVSRQGALDRDLDGNTIIDLTVSYTGDVDEAFLYQFANLRGDEGSLAKPAEVRLIRYDAIFPCVDDGSDGCIPVNDVWAEASMTYDMRVVTSGDKTINEGDDTVELVSGSAELFSNVILPARAMRMTVYRLGVLNSDQDALQAALGFEPLTDAPCSSDDDRYLQFAGQAEAQTIYDWLEVSRDKLVAPIVVTPNALVLCLIDESHGLPGRRPLTQTDIQKLTILSIDLN